MRWTLLLIATLFLVATATVAGAATVAYWRFEEGAADTVASGSGSVLDETGVHHGTPHGTDGPVYRGDVATHPVPGTWEANKLAFEFDGVDDYVEAADHADFDLTHQVTAEALFKPTGNPGGSLWKGLVTKGAGWAGESSYQLYYNTTGQRAFVRLRLDDDTFAEVSGSGSLTLGQWYHAALVADIADDGSGGGAGGTVHLYVTGVTTDFYEHKSAAIATGRTMKLNNAAVQIGTATNEGVRYFDGLIDEARVSNAALSTDQFLMPFLDAPLVLTQRIHDTDFDGNGNILSDANIVAGEYDAGSNWENRGFAVFELPDLAEDEFIESATLKLYLQTRHDAPNPADLYHLQSLNRDSLVLSDFEASGSLVVESFVDSSDPYGWYQQDVLAQIEDDYASDPAADRYAAFRLQIHDFVRDEDGQSERYWFTYAGDNKPVLFLTIGRVPEPSSALLAAMGFAGLLALGRRRRRD